jgi:hypothetical protein
MVYYDMSCEWFLVSLRLELLDLIDVVDVVLDAVEDGEGFG